MSEKVLKRSSRLRRAVEYWLMRKFVLRYGPAMMQRRGYWQFIDYYGDVYRLEPTNQPGEPLLIICEDQR